jgi:hypothetical protein
VNLVSLAEARAHLRIDDELDSNGDPIAPDDDPYLAMQVAAASHRILTHLKGYRFVWVTDIETDADGYPVLDSNGDAIPVIDTNGQPVYALDSNGDRQVAEPIKAATLLLLGHLWKDRDENPETAFEFGFLPKPVTALLYPYRDPTVR